MKGMRLDPEDVMAAARAKGIGSIFDVKYAVLERNGAISVIKRERKRGLDQLRYHQPEFRTRCRIGCAAECRGLLDTLYFISLNY